MRRLHDHSRGNAVDGVVLPVGGFICGCLAGFAAQYGRLCTVGAIEDALMAGDFRRASAWAVAAAIAILLTQALVFAEALDLSATHYVQSQLDLFGLDRRRSLVRPRRGARRHLRVRTARARSAPEICARIVSAVILGLAAFAATGGILSPIRTRLAEFGAIDTTGIGGKTLTGIADVQFGKPAAVLCALLVPGSLLAFGLANQRLLPQAAARLLRHA